MKKALIICYYWPPAGGPGVQRWLKFVKYLRDYDVEPVVYIPENANYPIRDESLLAEIPKGITILENRIWEPYALAGLFSKKETKKISSGIIKAEEKQNWLQKLMLFVRGNLFIPDARKFWVKPSVSYLSDYLSNNAVDCLITTGPPHSLHLIGLELKKKFKLPWIADFRDPWTSIGYHKKLKLTAKAQQKHKKLESEVLNEATHILVTSPKTKTDFSRLTQTPISSITNGFDEERVEQSPLDEKFSLAHIGSLLEDRNPLILWEVLAELKHELPDFEHNLKIELIGRVGDSVIETIEKFGLKKNLEVPGYLSHQEALVKQRSAQLLLLLEIDSEETQVIIPGKLFEYLAAQRPIIALGPKDSDVTNIIAKAEGGRYFTYAEKQGLKEELRKKYEAYLTTGIANTTGDLKQFTRRHLTEQLAQVIHAM